MCLMSCVACCVDLSLTKATDSPPAYSPYMHSKLVCKDQKPDLFQINKKKTIDTTKNSKASRGIPILEICSLTQTLLFEALMKLVSYSRNP